MKYLFLLMAIAAIYVLFIRDKAVSPASSAQAPSTPAQTVHASAPAQPAPAGTNVFKRPLDRTNQVLNQVAAKQRDENF